jgi:hypothetical protein
MNHRAVQRFPDITHLQPEIIFRRLIPDAMPERSPIARNDERDRRELFMELLDPVHDNLARFARGMTRDRR